MAGGVGRTNVIEHPEVVAGRIGTAVVALGDAQRVIAGADCGFATFAGFMRAADDVTSAGHKGVGGSAGINRRQVARCSSRSRLLRNPKCRIR